MSKNTVKEYYLSCVKCPFCHEIVEAKVTETKEVKTIFCPACKAMAKYKVDAK